MFPFRAGSFQKITRVVVAIGLALLMLVLTTYLPRTTAQASGAPAAPLLADPFTISNPSDTAVAAPLLAPSISASKRDTLAVDDGDGQAEPGETIRYTVHITNGGPDPATGVAFNDTIDLNTTLVAGSVNVSPLARDDTYIAVGNTLLEVGVTASGLPSVKLTGSVLDNDSEFLGDTFSLQTPLPTTSANGGTVTMEADGNFSYLPPVGFTGNDTFTYTITDGSLTGTGVVNITVTNRVWFVRNNAAAGGSGRSNAPFNTLAAAETASAINDFIYVHRGDGTTTNHNAGITLKNGQRLIGEGVALVVGSSTLHPAGSTPLIGNGSGAGITLAQNNTVRGLNIGTSAPAITGTNFGTLTLDTVSINTNGAALTLDTGTANATFTTVDSTGGARNVSLTGVSGTIALGAGALSGATADNLFMSGGTGSLSFSGTITAGANVQPVDIANKTGGTVTLSGLISTAAATTSGGISLVTNSGSTFAFTGGVQLTTGANAAFTATGGGSLEVTGSNNTLTTTTGQAVNLANVTRTTNGISFRSVTVNGAGTGILLNNVAGSTAFQISGTGSTDASGGTISNVANRGVSVINTNNVILNNMSFTNTPSVDGGGNCGDLEVGQPGNDGCNAAIHFDTVTGPSMNNVDINGGVQQGVNGRRVTNFSLTFSSLNNIGDEIDESGVRLQDVFGTSTISNNSIVDGYETNLYVINTQATAGTLTVSANTLNNSTLGGGAYFATDGTANLTVNATSNIIQNNFTQGLLMAFDGTTGSFNATLNTVLNGGSPGISVGGFSGTGTYNISNNSVTNPDFVSYNAGATNTGTISGRIANNTTDGPEQTAANSIVVTANGSSNHTALVEGNQITNYDGTSTAMFILANQGSAAGNFTVRNNTVNGDGNIGATNGILVRVGSLATDTNNVCLAVYGNDVNGWNPAITALRVHLRFNTVTNHYRNGQTGTDDAILTANNPAIPNTPADLIAYDTSSPAVSNQTNTPCTLPSFARPAFEEDVRQVTGLTDEKFTFAAPQPEVNAESGADTTANDEADVVAPVVEEAAPLAQAPEANSESDAPSLAGETISFTVGTLPSNKRLIVVFDAVISNPVAAGANSISNQGTISGANFANVLTNDPDTGAANDATLTTLVAQPDYSINKTDSIASVVPGGSITYTLQYTNSGNQGGASVRLTETVPANTSFDALASSGGWVCTPNNNAGSTCVNNVGTVNGGGVTGSRVFAVTVINPVPAGVTQISNTASIGDNGANGADPTPANNSEGETTPVTAQPDITISKSDGGASGTPGGTVTYALTVSNVGNQGATGVVATETVPANTTFNAGASSAGWSCTPNNNAGSTCTLTVGALNGGGGSVSRNFAVTVVNPVAAGVTQISNTATAADDGTNGTDPTLPNTSTDTTPINATPDITVSKTDGGISTTPGGTVAYTVTVSNVGNQNATGVVLTETVPANTTFNSASSTAGWSCTNGSPAGTTCTQSIGALNGGGASTTRRFAVTVVNPVAAGVNQISNTASAADDGTNGTDPTLPNNGSDTTPVTAQPDYSLTKSDGGISTTPGSTVAYTLNYGNVGNQGGTGVALSETVPANTTFNAGASTAGWVCAPNNNAGSTCTLAIGGLNAGGSGSATFAVTVINPVPAGVIQISNTANISDDGANGTDPTLPNTAADTTPLTAVPDLSVVKGDGNITGTPGNVITYTIAYTNSGNQGATGVVLNEVVPAHTTFNAGASSAGWSCANGSPAGTPCIFNIGNVAGGGGTGTRTFAVTVNASLPGGTVSTSNTVTISDDGANGTDPTPANNSDTEVTPVFAAPDMQIQKGDAGVSVTPGGTVVYSLAYSNTGTIGATGVVISEIVPANTTFNAGSSSAGWSCTPNGNAGNPCTITIGSVAVNTGGSRNFAVTVVNPVAAGVTQISNTATIAEDGTNGTDPDTSNNTDTETTPVNAVPNMSISKSDGGTTTTPGSTIVYTLNYSNAGNQGATGVVLNETVPANTTFNAGASSAGWSCTPNGNAGNPCTLTIGAVAGGGGSGTRTFAVTVANPVPAGVTQISNTATVADDGANGTDPVPANNSASDTTPVTATPDLSLNKDDGGMSATLGTVIPYNLTVTNSGNQGATGVSLSETVPANTTFNAGGSSAGWVCVPNNNAGSACTITVGSLNGGGATATRVFAVQVNAVVPPSTTQISNSASVADDGTNGTDPTPANNSDTETTPLNIAANLGINKSVNTGTAVPGQTITYTIAYSNAGPQLSTSVVITDPIPAQLQNVSFTASPPVTATAGMTYVWQVGTVAAGGSGTITVVGTVNPSIAADTTITNTATIRGNFDSTNSSDNAVTNVVLPRVRFAATNVDFTEETANATITVTLDRPNPYRAITVQYDTSDGTATAGADYTDVTGVITFTAGMTQSTFTIPVLEDTIDEANETVNLTLSSPNGAVLGSPVAATLTILDDDNAPTIALSSAAHTVGEGDGTVAISVTLSNPSAFTVTVDYATADGTATAGADYTAVSDTLTFAPGETSGSFNVAILEDVIFESDEAFGVALSNPVSGTLGSPSSGTVKITENDSQPTIAFSNAAYSVGEGDGTGTITVTLSNPSVFTVTVDYATGGGTATAGTDYTGITGTLTFAPGSTSETFDVAIFEDTTDENDETVDLTLSNPTGGTLGTPNPATLTILDNDGEPTINFPTGNFSVDESDSTATITVTLSNPSDFTVTVDYETGNGTATAGDDYVSASGTLTFTPGVTSTTFSVSIINDALDEDDETVLLTLTNPTVFELGGGATATLTIIDDDATPTAAVNDVQVIEGNSGTTPMVFNVTLSALSGLPVTVNYNTSNGTATAGSDYVAASGQLVIPAGSISGTVTVNINGDLDFEPDETLFLNLNTPVNPDLGGNQGTGTILNDDIATAVSLSTLNVTSGDVRNHALMLLPFGIIAAWWLWRRKSHQG